MAATVTWSAGPYRYETAGKGFVDQVEYRLTGVDGEVTDSSVYGSVNLDRPSDDDMEDRSAFATEEKLVAAVKAKLGSDAVTSAEDSCKATVAALAAPTHATAMPE